MIEPRGQLHSTLRARGAGRWRPRRCSRIWRLSSLGAPPDHFLTSSLNTVPIVCHIPLYLNTPERACSLILVLATSWGYVVTAAVQKRVRGGSFETATNEQGDGGRGCVRLVEVIFQTGSLSMSMMISSSLLCAALAYSSIIFVFRSHLTSSPQPYGGCSPCPPA